jgi:hypothetical protein
MTQSDAVTPMPATATTPMLIDENRRRFTRSPSSRARLAFSPLQEPYRL